MNIFIFKEYTDQNIFYPAFQSEIIAWCQFFAEFQWWPGTWPIHMSLDQLGVARTWNWKAPAPVKDGCGKENVSEESRKYQKSVIRKWTCQEVTWEREEAQPRCQERQNNLLHSNSHSVGPLCNWYILNIYLDIYYYFSRRRVLRFCLSFLKTLIILFFQNLSNIFSFSSPCVSSFCRVPPSGSLCLGLIAFSTIHNPTMWSFLDGLDTL